MCELIEKHFVVYFQMKCFQVYSLYLQYVWETFLMLEYTSDYFYPLDYIKYPIFARSFANYVILLLLVWWWPTFMTF